MRGKKPLGNARCVLMYFSPKDDADLDYAIEKRGMTPRDSGLAARDDEEKKGTD